MIQTIGSCNLLSFFFFAEQFGQHLKSGKKCDFCDLNSHFVGRELLTDVCGFPRGPRCPTTRNVALKVALSFETKALIICCLALPYILRFNGLSKQTGASGSF